MGRWRCQPRSRGRRHRHHLGPRQQMQQLFLRHQMQPPQQQHRQQRRQQLTQHGKHTARQHQQLGKGELGKGAGSLSNWRG